MTKLEKEICEKHNKAINTATEMLDRANELRASAIQQFESTGSWDKDSLIKLAYSTELVRFYEKMFE